MTTLEIIRRLVAVIEPNDPQSEAIKQAVLALLEKEEPKTAKKEPAKKSPGGWRRNREENRLTPAS